VFFSSLLGAFYDLDRAAILAIRSSLEQQQKDGKPIDWKDAVLTQVDALKSPIQEALSHCYYDAPEDDDDYILIPPNDLILEEEDTTTIMDHSQNNDNEKAPTVLLDSVGICSVGLFRSS
jgi:hypothetical protein